MIAKAYQELKKNGSQFALWKKLIGDTTPGHSKLQLATRLITEQLIFSTDCFVIWISVDVLRQLKHRHSVTKDAQSLAFPLFFFSLFLPVSAVPHPASILVFLLKPLDFLSPTVTLLRRLLIVALNYIPAY